MGNGRCEGGGLAARRVVLFDFDGTLADTKPVIIRIATEVLADFGLDEEARGDVSRLIGPPFPEAFSEVYGLSEEEALRVTLDYRSRFRKQGPDAWPLFPGIADLVGALRAQGKIVCVATSKQQEVLEQALSDEGMSHAFDVAFGKTTDRPFSKEQTIRSVLEMLGASAEEAVMVGDRSHDVIGALACGVPCVGVTYGGTGDYAELSGAGACRVVDTVAQLADTLLGVVDERP